MLHISDAEWAARLLSKANLGDVRRNKRCETVVSAMLQHPGKSLLTAACGHEGRRELFYRYARSEHVDPTELLAAGCTATAQDILDMAPEEEILLIGDTTTLGYRHCVRDELGLTGSSKDAHKRGWIVHTILAVCAKTSETLGPIEQFWWMRPPEEFGKRSKDKTRCYDEKESFKWEASACSSLQRLSEIYRNLVFVTDRESDIYEYLVHLHGEDMRYVIRNCSNRRTKDEYFRVWEHCLAQPVLCDLALEMPQKGGRPSRVATLAMRVACITVRPPKDVEGSQPCITTYSITLDEITPPEGIEPIRWVLFTSENVLENMNAAIKVVTWYSRRWRIEEYHRFWKSEGMRVEDLRMSTAENLQRVAVLQSFVACPLMRLRDSAVPPISRLSIVKIHKAPPDMETKTCIDASTMDFGDRPCTELLTTVEWNILWMATEKSTPPILPPSRRWASYAVAKLGGWFDSKRTGRPGYRAYIMGWLCFAERCEAFSDFCMLRTIHLEM